MTDYIPPRWSDLPDWQRRVAKSLNELLRGYPYPLLDSAPTEVSAGFTYYDTALNKVRTWDGTTWQGHW